MNPLLYAVGNFVTEAPWYFMTTVPFWGNERIKKNYIFAIILAVNFLRMAASCFLITYVPDGYTIDSYTYTLLPIIFLAVYLACFKMHITKLLYTTLLTFSFATPISFLAALVIQPFLTLSEEVDLDLTGETSWIIAASLLTAASLPFVYRLYSRLLRRALSEFTAKTAAYLCITPALFYMIYVYAGVEEALYGYHILIAIPLLGLFCALVNLRMVKYMHELADNKSDMQTLEMKSEFMLENYQTLEKHFTEIAQMKHEMRHHLFAVRELCENGEREQLLKYLSDIQGDFAEIEGPVACDNRVIQAVLGHAARRAKEMMFQIEFKILSLPPLTVPDTDIVSLFMNLLDNALESCSHIENPKDRWIKVRLKTRQPYFCLSVANARQGTLNQSGDAYISTKTEPVLHGHGIEVVRKITEKHGGLASFEHDTDSFTVEVALPAM